MKYQPDNINALQIEKVRKSYAIFLESWFWNIHATINFSYHNHYKISNERALKLAFKWIKKKRGVRKRGVRSFNLTNCYE